MRHATAWYDGMPQKARSTNLPGLTKQGEQDAAGVAARFVEFLTETGIDPSAVVVYDVGTDQSRATANIMRSQLGTRSSSPPASLEREQLGPRRLSAYSTNEKILQKAWQDVAPGLDSQAYRVIVGHDPQMSWLLHLLAGRQAKWYSLATSELVLVEAVGQGRSMLRWVFSPSDSGTAEELRAKIKSKMDTAKALGAFLTALLTFTATQLLGADEQSVGLSVLAGSGLTLLAAATVLYFISLFWYDELLMPKRFWPTRPSRAGAGRERRAFVRRPPGSDVWVLYQNMLHVWNWSFIPATVLGACGVGLIAVGFAEPKGAWWLAAVAAVVAVLGVGVPLGLHARPRLGVND